MAKALADNEQINKVADEIRRRQFPRIITFSDVIVRYLEKRLRRRVSWLNIHFVFLLAQRGGTLTISEIAGMMLRSTHSMTRLTDVLEKDGLVKRRRISKDRRTVHVTITNSGLDFIRRVLDDVDEYEKGPLTALTKSEMEILTGLLEKLRSSLVEEMDSRKSKRGVVSTKKNGRRRKENTENIE